MVSPYLGADHQLDEDLTISLASGRCIAALSFSMLFGAPAFAQIVGGVALPPELAVEDVDASEAIIVTAPRLRGTVDVDIPPELELSPTAIESYGVSSVAELLAALAPQTRTGRGRGGGGPVVLVNGKRVSGFAEIRDLPPEAIQKVEIFAEDVALRFGYSPDQRVINFILKPDFASIAGELEFGTDTRGNRVEYEAQASYLRISKTGRINLSAQYERDTAILERDRAIVRSVTDTGQFRTLSPASQTVQINSILNRSLSDRVNATLNLRYEDRDSDALLGLPTALQINPAAAPLAALTRQSNNRSFHAGLSVDGNWSRWQWTMTANHDIARSSSRSDRDSADPLVLSQNLVDLSRSHVTNSNAIWSVSGPLAKLPAGAISVSLRAGVDHDGIESRSERASGIRLADIARTEGNGRINVDIPLADRGRNVAAALGDLSINAAFEIKHLSDFGSLTLFGYGLKSSPIKGLTLLAGITVEQAAPSQQQLADPIILTPNVTVYDFARGETVLVDLISGGNPALRSEERRDLKIGLSYNPPALEALTLSANYFDNRSDNLLSAFPTLNLDIERAFPGRITRNAAGRLTAIDQRAINFSGARTEQLRWGIQFAKEFGQPAAGQGGQSSRGSPGTIPGGPGAGGPGAGGSGGGRPPGAGGGPRGPGGMGGGGFGRFGGGNGGRWQVSLFHTLKFRDEVDFGGGLPKLDLLDGGATGATGGSPRHAVDLEGGWFHKGIGIRLFGTYASATTVAGGSLGGGAVAPDLKFSDLLTLNARLFVNFNNRTKLIKKMPFLKGSRLALRVDNLTDSVQTVRDSNGAVPFRYQPGFLDPLGRRVEISFRKLF